MIDRDNIRNTLSFITEQYEKLAKSDMTCSDMFNELNKIQTWENQVRWDLGSVFLQEMLVKYPRTIEEQKSYPYAHNEKKRNG